MSYQTALSGLDWSMVPSGMSIPAAGISAMTTYESGMGAILASNNVGALNIDISSSNYTGTIGDITNEIIAISGTTSSNRTITLYFNASTQNGVKSYKVYIPSASLVAGSGGPYTLTITTGLGTSVGVPIIENGLTPTLRNLLFSIYVDSLGNVSSDVDIYSLFPTVYAYYNGGGSGTPNNYPTKIEDNYGAVTTGSAWKFTAPLSGVYSISSYSLITSTSGANSLRKNGSNYVQVYYSSGGAGVGFAGGGAFELKIRLVAGDYIDMAVSTNSAYIQIARIGT